MATQVVTALIAAFVGIVTTLLTVLYGPTWKARLDRRRDQEDRSERLLARYSEPLARAAYDLQSRLYNMRRPGFLDSRYIPESYSVRSTLWLFGQYLGWVEILRREVQVLELGDVRRTARLQLHLLDIADVLASSTDIRDPVFNIRRAEQRALGELVVVDREVSGEKRSDCMGYAEFNAKMKEADFAAWFQPLGNGMEILTRGINGHTRPIHLQRALIDLVDFLDPNLMRFPDPNDRGKVSLPPGVAPMELRKQARPAGELARFRYESDPCPIVNSWVATHRLTVVDKCTDSCLVRLPSHLSVLPLVQNLRALANGSLMGRCTWYPWVNVDRNGRHLSIRLLAGHSRAGNEPGGRLRVPPRVFVKSAAQPQRAGDKTGAVATRTQNSN
jgi:hypothetical protein